MRASYWSIETQTASFTAFASVNSDDADSQETAFKSLCLHFCKQNENIIRVYISMMSRANYVQKCSQYHLNCTEQKQFLYVRNIFLQEWNVIHGTWTNYHWGQNYSLDVEMKILIHP